MTTSLFPVVSAASLLGFFLLGCSASPEPNPVSTATDAAVETPDAGASAPDSGTIAKTISFAVKLVDATAQDTALQGVNVCVPGRSDVACAKSGADGAVKLGLPAGAEVMIGCENKAYGPVYMTWTLGNADLDAGRFGVFTRSTASSFVELSGGKLTPTAGALMVNVYEDLVERTKRVSGATFTLTPKAGGGPTYVSATKLPQPSLTASTEGGPGLFYDLAPGDYTVTIAHPTRTCKGGFGWKAEGPTSLRSRVFGGGISNVTFVCPP